MRISKIKAAGDEITGGKWVGDIPGLPGVSLFVTGLSNIASRRLGAELINALPPEKRRDIDELEKIQRRQFCEVIVKGWQGFEDDNGDPLEFSRETLARLMKDDGIAAVLMDAFTYAADRVGRVEADAFEADVKN